MEEALLGRTRVREDYHMMGEDKRDQIQVQIHLIFPSIQQFRPPHNATIETFVNLFVHPIFGSSFSCLTLDSRDHLSL